MGDDLVEFLTESDTLENKLGVYDRIWLKESKVNLLKQVEDEKRANLIMSRMQSR